MAKPPQNDKPLIPIVKAALLIKEEPAAGHCIFTTIFAKLKLQGIMVPQTRGDLILGYQEELARVKVW